MECTINPLKLPCPPVYMVCTSPVAGTSSVSVLQPHWRVLVSTSRILSLSTWSSNMLLANEQCKEVKGVWPVLRMLYSHTRAFSMVLRCASRFVSYNFATNQTTNTATCHQAPLPLSNHHNGPSVAEYTAKLLQLVHHFPGRYIVLTSTCIVCRCKTVQTIAGIFAYWIYWFSNHS